MKESTIENFYNIIKESGEFDEEFYLNCYPDVKESGEDPILHYITKGAKKLYNPTTSFSTDFYIHNHNDILNKINTVGFDNFNPFVHYIQYGKRENRKTQGYDPIFDISSEDFIKNPDLIMNRFNHLERLIQSHNKQLSSFNEVINLIFSNFDIKAKGILRLEQLLALELLKLFDIFCKRNNLEYWLDAGTLLGSIRHRGFIPWDDDMDVSMMRKDFNIFIKTFLDEISKNDYLKDNITINYHGLDENWKINPQFVLLFAQVIFKKPLVKFDIFIYDYADKTENFKNELKEVKRAFLNDIVEGKCSIEEGVSKYNALLNAKYEKSDLIFTSIDSFPSYRVYDYDTIFPLTDREFEEYIFPCPNKWDIVLNDNYGKKYMELPKIIAYHDRVKVITSQFESEKEAQIELIRAIHDLKGNIQELYGDVDL